MAPRNDHLRIVLKMAYFQGMHHENFAAFTTGTRVASGQVMLTPPAANHFYNPIVRDTRFRPVSEVARLLRRMP